MCFIDRDFSVWQSRVVLPLSLITEVGQVHLRNALELRLNFEQYLKCVDAMSLDHVIRRPISLDCCADGNWIGTYETNLMSNGRRMVEPYESSAVLEWDGAKLRASSVMNARSPVAGYAEGSKAANLM